MNIILAMVLLWAAFVSSNVHAETGDKMLGNALEYIAQGDTETVKLRVSVTDCETGAPMLGAKATLSYHKQVSGPRDSFFRDLGNCSGETTGATDEKGKVKLGLTVSKCPHAFIGTKEEDMDIEVSARGYERNRQEVKSSSVSICLARAAWEVVVPPIALAYPKYWIDLERYSNVFHGIQEVNRRNIGEKGPKQNYVVWRYASTRAGHDEGFTEFLEKIRETADIRSIPLLKEILSKQYPLPYKSYKTSNEESWRADDYVYGLGRNAASRAIINIADDRLNELLPLAIDVPAPYLAFLKDAGITMNSEIYWEYLSEKYASRQGLLPGEGTMKPDPRVLVVSLLKERLPQQEYERKMVAFYVLLNKLSRESRGEPDRDRNMHNYDSQRYLAMREKVASELFVMKPLLFAPEVLKVLGDMEVSDMTRRYLQYLYDVGEHKAIAAALPGNRNLMRSFLGLDILDQREDPRRYYYSEERKKSLLPKMPKVAKTSAGEIEKFIEKEMKRSAGLASWAIQNLAVINRSRADILAKELYLEGFGSHDTPDARGGDASGKRIKKHTGSQDRYVRQSALVGAAEARLPGLCKVILDELDITKDFRADFFSLGYYRIEYLNNACPVQMNTFVKSFDYKTVLEKSKNKYFEEGYEHQLPGAIWEFFPKERGDKLLNDYYVASEEEVLRIYSGSKGPPRYSVPYLCQRFERDLATMTSYQASRLLDYLDACYPERKQEHDGYRRLASGQDASTRTYEAFRNMTREKKGNEYHFPTPVYEKGFRSFFITKPTGSPQGQELKQQEQFLDRNTAFSILGQGVKSEDPLVQQASLYALAWFPSGRPADLVGAVRGYAKGETYPHYVYAAYGLAPADPGDTIVRSASARAAEYHITTIEKRAYIPDPRLFAVTSVRTLDLCRMTGQSKYYERLLDLMLQPGTVAHYEGFEADLEKIIATSSISRSTMIRLIESRRAPDIVLAVRLAEIKNSDLGEERLRTLLAHDDSFVRRVAAAYVLSHRAGYPVLLESLKNNTNRRVRAMYAEAMK